MFQFETNLFIQVTKIIPQLWVTLQKTIILVV